MTAKRSAGDDIERIRESVRARYEQLAARPDDAFDFNCGARYAQQHLNYPAEELAAVPVNSLRRFSGAGNPHRIGTIQQGETVLDHACGAGMDLLIAARKVGPGGRAIGVDMTPGMLAHAWQGALQAGMDGWVSLFDGIYEELPVDDASVDLVISNGVLNLALDKPRVLAEVFRVLRPGGRLYLSDVVLQGSLDTGRRQDASLWADCIGGALPERELLEVVALAGLVKSQITERFDCFRGAPAEDKVSRELRVGAINLFAHKPGT